MGSLRLTDFTAIDVPLSRERIAAMAPILDTLRRLVAWKLLVVATVVSNRILNVIVDESIRRIEVSRQAFLPNRPRSF